MSYDSIIYPGEIVFGDTTPDSHGDPPAGFSTGWEPEPEGFSSPVVSEPSVKILSWAEIDERIEEMERTNTRFSDRIKRRGWVVKNQNGTNYCWINAPTAAIESVRLTQGGIYIPLSPASAGAIIKRFRNVGGWGTEGLQFIAERGLVPSSIWPDNAISRRYDNAESDAERPKHRCLEWDRLPANNMQVLLSYLCQHIPVPVGYNWWRHEVLAVDPIKQGRTYGCRIANSWGTGWGDRGYGILLGRKASPDDAVAPRTIVPLAA